MNKRQIGKAATAIGGGALAALVAFGWTGSAVGADAPGKIPASTVELPVNLALMPVKTFAAKCVECHGPQATGFVPEAFELTAKQMGAQMIAMMVRKVKLKPTEPELEAMAAYIRSAQGGAFVAIANGADFAQGKTAKLTGEAAPGSSVVLVKDGKETAILVDEKTGAWTLDAAPQAPFALKGTFGEAVAEVEFPKEQWDYAPSKNRAPFYKKIDPKKE